jgi:hypothetical protein
MPERTKSMAGRGRLPNETTKHWLERLVSNGASQAQINAVALIYERETRPQTTQGAAQSLVSGIVNLTSILSTSYLSNCFSF